MEVGIVTTSPRTPRRGSPAQRSVDLAPTSHLRSPGGKDMSNRYSVVCMTCRYQSSHSSRWEANIDVAAHLRDNPTHSVTVVEEGQGATRRKAS
jgi:hypothetical protein